MYIKTKANFEPNLRFYTGHYDFCDVNTKPDLKEYIHAICSPLYI